MSSPAPKSPEQSDKSKKYDRQLRLWGEHGQKLLENAKVCLINANALGIETLKSLVLPGIGSFTIVDGETVTEEDIGSNFFLEDDSLGLPRAQVATQCLLELNSDVRGDFIDESLEHIMANTQDFFKNFTVVIASAVPEKYLIPLSKHLWESKIPLLVCRTIGFLGYIRLQVNEHFVLESHPDNENPDLRLDAPWPELGEYLESYDLTKLDAKTRTHTPAVVILYHCLVEYREKYGEIPKTRAEKDILRGMIEKAGITDESLGSAVLEENFREALHYVNTCTTPAAIPSNVQTILDDKSCTNLTTNSSPFWVICAGLREHILSPEGGGSLPVRGSLPDMSADTASYVTLQNIYHTRAMAQAESVYRRASQIAANLGLSQDLISEAEVKRICKHATELHIIRGSCIADEYQRTTLDLSSYLEDPDSLMFYYVILRGLERFIGEFNAYPGQFDDQVEPDVLKLKGIVSKLLAEWGCSHAMRDERVHEVCRYGGAELHSVSATLGGCAAHEIIKLITHQYKPLNNAFFYDAITANSATFCL